MTSSPLPHPSRRVSRPVRAVVLATGMLGTLYLAVPDPRLTRVFLPLLAICATGVALALRARRSPPGERLPWLLATAGVACFAISDLLIVSWPAWTGVTHPWPGPAHLPFQAGVALLIGALFVIVRLRRGRDPSSTLDAVIVSTSLGVATWVFVVTPMTTELGTDAWSRAGLVSWPLLHVALLVAAWRLFQATRAGPPAARALMIGSVSLVATSGGMATLVLLERYRPEVPLSVGWLVTAGCLTLSAVHPSAVDLTAAATPKPQRSAARRIAGPALASLVLPTALLFNARDAAGFLLAVAAAAVLLLVTVRVWRLLHGLETMYATDVADQRDRDERRFSALVRHTADVMLVVDGEGNVTYASPSAEGLVATDPTGWDRHRLTGLIHPDERDATVSALRERLASSAGRPVRLHARLVDRADGQAQHADVVAVDLLADPDVRGIVFTIHETTERTELEAELRQLAFHDALTGLPNRELFQDRLAHALNRARRTGRRVAVLLADLDDFKDVNDTLGHPAGDQLLQELARRLQSSLRATDTVARLGGDEFAVLCEDLDATRDAVLAARRLLAATDEAIDVDGRELRIGLSVGIAVDSGERNAEELLRDADVALYEAKAQGKQRWSLHVARMTVRAQARLQLAADLARTVADDQLEVAYQPIHSLADDRIVGVEALARWDHPERGPVAPDEFIALAEQNGLILRLGHRVLNHALTSLRSWVDDIPELVLKVSINVSARQLRDPKLVARVGAALDRSEIPPESLILELTESVMLADPDQAMEVMRDLRRLGVRFAVDDFGTGYSSLAYLRQLPVDIVKIDRSFIRELTTDRASRDLVRAIIELGRGMELDVLAEGVETDEQRRVLREMGCDFAQGFHFARPMPPDALLRRLGAPDAPIVRAPILGPARPEAI